MKIQQFLEHHSISRNPFADEDAQTDPIFKESCIESTYHPTWDKVYGDPAEPATSIVFGEKGSGKTAMRLQIARHIESYNEAHPNEQRFIIHYDDFNPFLDRFHDSVGSRRKADRVLTQWRLWDHMDAILSIGVTGLVDRILETKQPSSAVSAQLDQDKVDLLDHHQARDLLLLAACYDRSTAETFKGRWHRLRRRLKFIPWRAYVDFAGAIGWSALILLVVILSVINGATGWLGPLWLWLIVAAAGWIPWLWRVGNNVLLARAITQHLRVGNHDSGTLRQTLMNFAGSELSGQPLPNKDRTDDRYELLCKLQAILTTMGYTGIFVLVDRIDEPHLVNGSADLMKAVLWPMLDNKFLKHPGLGLKLMVPEELMRFVDREDRDFYQRARLDKQNMISSFAWTGQALYDVINARIRACAENGKAASIRDLLDEGLSEQRVLEALQSLRVPRHVFKFMHRLLVAHCNAHTDEQPSWRIDAAKFESELALFRRDQDSFDRGLGAG